MPGELRHPLGMLSRRAWSLSISGALLSLAAPELAFAAQPRELFTLARSTNANVVKYAVRLGKEGQLEVAHPIEAYWLMLAGNGHREELTWSERQLAYGFSTSEVTPRSCVLRLSACPDRQLRVAADNGSFVARLEIARQPATLQRIFVRTEGSLLPSVRYVEISGLNTSNQRVVERILPR